MIFADHIQIRFTPSVALVERVLNETGDDFFVVHALVSVDEAPLW